MQYQGRVKKHDKITAYMSECQAYRFSFNGQEKDDEITGVTGSHLDFGARIYDARIGRWLSIDKYWSKFPALSGYSYAANSPIIIIDEGGNVIKLVGTDEEKRKNLCELQKLTNDELQMANDGTVLIVTHGSQNPETDLQSGTNLIQELIDDENTGTVMSVEHFRSEYGKLGEEYKNWKGNVTFQVGDADENSYNGVGVDASTVFDENDMGDEIKNEDGTTGRPTEIGMGHELIHLRNLLKGILGKDEYDIDYHYIDPDSGSEID